MGIVPGRSTLSLDMTKTYRGDVNTRLEPAVSELRSRLASAHEDLVGLMPDELKALLLDHRDLKMDDSAFDWACDVAEGVLKCAKPRPAKEMNDYGSLSDRAFCPLCGRSSTNLHGEHGFAYPEGLRSHLLGTHTARECAVMKAARELAREEISRRRAGRV